MLPISKYSSKASSKAAGGINWSVAEKKYLEGNDSQPSREAITRLISEDPFFSREDIENILNIKIEDDFLNILNKHELIFIEIGGYLNKSLNQFNEIKDYLKVEKRIKDPGGLADLIDFDLSDPAGMMRLFSKLNDDQEAWHERARIIDEKGLGDDKYLTHEVVHDFNDGWVVVYLPAIGEGPNYKGDDTKSNDRTVEGNKNGLCLGTSMGLYQNNDDGKMYSVRDPSNKPRATIRISETLVDDSPVSTLWEVKGKSNLSPGFGGAKHADIWFKLLKSESEFYYEDNEDYESFPPVTKEAALKEISEDVDSPYNDGWVVHWYKNGIDSLDADVKSRLEKNDPLILYSGLHKKYKELSYGVAEHWMTKYYENDDPTFFMRQVEPADISWPGEVWMPEHLKKRGIFPYELEDEHEAWKTYRNEPWMKNGLEKLFDHFEFPEKFGRVFKTPVYVPTDLNWVIFKLELHKLNDTLKKRGGAILSKYLNEYAQKSPIELQDDYWEEGKLKGPGEGSAANFFGYELYEDYPELTENASKKLSVEDPGAFFFSTAIISESMSDSDYTDLELQAATNFAKLDPEWFFEQGISQKYDNLVGMAGESLAKKNPVAFFERNLHGQVSEDITLEAARELLNTPSGIEFFIDKKFYEYHPDLEELAWSRYVTEYLAKTNSNYGDAYTAESFPARAGGVGAVGGLFGQPIGDISLYGIAEADGDGYVHWRPSALRRHIAHFINSGMHKKYPNLLTKESGSPTEAMSRWVSTEPVEFFKKKLYISFPQFIDTALNKMIRSTPWLFFDIYDLQHNLKDSAVKNRATSLEDKFPYFAPIAAKRLAGFDLRWFFLYDLHKKFPKIGTDYVEGLIETHPGRFFDARIHQYYDDPIYVEVAVNNLKELGWSNKKIEEKIGQYLWDRFGFDPEERADVFHNLRHWDPEEKDFTFEENLTMPDEDGEGDEGSGAPELETGPDDENFAEDVKDKMIKLYNWLNSNGFKKEARALYINLIINTSN